MTNDDDDLRGFKDFLDGERSDNEKKMSKARKSNDFELVTFLEQDSERLSRHIETFEEKVYVMKNFPQDPSLNIEAENKNIETKKEVITLCLKSEAPIYRNLAEVFNNFFQN